MNWITGSETSESEGVFSALRHPWVPVVYRDDSEARRSLVDVLSESGDIRRLGAGLGPLERDAVFRLVVALAGVVVRRAANRGIDAEALDHIPPEDVDGFAEDFADYFWLRHPSRPFCQEWGLEQDDANGSIKPISALDVRIPGSSSSSWGRPVATDGAVSAEIAHDRARLTALLVTAWFHTKHANARDGHGRKFAYGAPGDVAVRSLGVHTHHREDFGLTLLSNIPVSWLNSCSLPAFLSQDVDSPGRPDDLDLVRDPLDLWRVTYARNTPLLHWTENSGHWRPHGFVLGPSTKAVPLIAASETESLKAMHSENPSRLFVEAGKPAEPRKAVSAMDVRLSSTEGFVRWYKGHLQTALPRRSARIEPLLDPFDPSEEHLGDWLVAAFAEVSDPQGNRRWVDYTFVPTGRLNAPAAMDDGRLGPAILPQVAEVLRFRAGGALRLAVEGRNRASTGDPVLKQRTERALLAAVEDDLAAALDTPASDTSFDAAEVAAGMRRRAIEVFDAATEPLRTPVNTPLVSAARAEYRGASFLAVESVINPEKATARRARTRSSSSTMGSPG